MARRARTDGDATATLAQLEREVAALRRALAERDRQVEEQARALGEALERERANRRADGQRRPKTRTVGARA